MKKLTRITFLAFPFSHRCPLANLLPDKGKEGMVGNYFERTVRLKVLG